MHIEPNDKKPNEDPVVANGFDSDERAASGEAEIESYDKMFPKHPALEDVDEISSTDDV